MKKLFIIALVIISSASVASAQVGNIGIFNDVEGLDCNVTDDAAGLKPFYIVHVNAACVTASQFAAVVPACWTAGLWLSDTAVFAVNIGTSQTGVAIGYGENLGSPIHALTINVFGQGLTTVCCEMTVTPAPAVASGEIEVVDCNNDLFLLGTVGGTAFIGQTASNCGCSVGVEETTWGAVKSLYAGE